MNIVELLKKKKGLRDRLGYYIEEMQKQPPNLSAIHFA
ncbi:hypothetical protein SAMN05421787_102106 [Virgibacillus pantothenticus]|nr:hypothetical protein SAMN05421787_102106 [Virgibacillus pantothenticus]